MQALEPGKDGRMTQKEAASCINTIELLRRLAYNVHGLMDVIDDENCKKIISLLKELSKYDWHPIKDGDGEMPPVDEEGYSDYILISFSNIIGQYREDDDGGAFYYGDDDEPLSRFGLIVNAYMEADANYWNIGGVKTKRKTGKWINTAPKGKSDNIVCNQCGYDSIADYKFCPNCGAKMEETE